MFINENVKVTVFNYGAQWSGVDDQEVDCSIISMGAMSYTKYRRPLDGMAPTKRNAQGHERYIKLFDLEINNLCVHILAAKMT